MCFPSASICPDTRFSIGLGRMTCKRRKPHLSKHTNPGIVRRWLNWSTTQDIHGIMMVRDPFANLASIRKNPYGLRHCADKRRWLAKPCVCTAYMQRYDQICEPNQSSFASLVDVWAVYATRYLSIAREANQTAGLYRGIVRYEDLVMNTRALVRSLGDRFGVPPQFDGLKEVLRRNAKTSSRQSRRDAAGKAKYMKTFTESELLRVCKQLDSNVLEELQYGRECARYSVHRNSPAPASPHTPVEMSMAPVEMPMAPVEMPMVRAQVQDIVDQHTDSPPLILMMCPFWILCSVWAVTSCARRGRECAAPRAGPRT